MSESKLSLPPTSLHLLSGALSGLASCIALQPCDLLKTRLQQAHLNPNHLPNLSIFQITSQVISRDGVLGLWRGTAPTILRNVPGIAVYFFSLAQLRSTMSTMKLFSQTQENFELLHHQHQQEQEKEEKEGRKKLGVLPTLTPTGDFFAGVLARTSVGFVLMPITIIKTRFESNLYEYSSIKGAFQDIVVRDGMGGLWRGFIPTVLRDAPFAGIFVTTYEASKRILGGIGREGAIINHTIPATLAAIVATLITAPFDLVKTHLQLGSVNSTKSPNSPIYNSFRRLLNGRPQNFFVLFKGSGLRLLRKSLSSAIGWTIYEGLIKKWAIKN